LAAVFLSLVVLATATTNSVWNNVIFNGASCSNAATVQESLASTTCTASNGCVSNGGFSGSVSCSPYTAGQQPPVFLSGAYAGVTTYLSGNCAAGTELSFTGISASGGCIAFQTSSFKATCTGSGNTATVSYSSWGASTTCAGNPTSSVTNAATTGCLGANNSGGFGAGVQFFCGTGSATCFHENTQITYKGQKYTRQALGDLKGECAIPHDVTSSGVAIYTDCNAKPLQLTPDHLVFTSRGLIQAGSIVVGDQVYRDLERTQKCTVTSTKQEAGKYFGLNCKESVVLADGIATSTFGRYHSIPAAWMHYAAAVIGVERASALGDAIAQTLYRVGLL